MSDTFTAGRASIGSAPQPALSVAHAFDSRENSFDFIRLVAAISVIYGHSFGMVVDPSFRDPVTVLFPYTYSGALAVDVFFLISGIFVTRSFISSGNAVEFLVKRCARIFPALAMYGFVIAFPIAIFTTRAPVDFLLSPLPWIYAFNNSLLETTYFIPQVFEGTPMKGIVNGALWTIRSEFRLYLLILVIGLLGVLTVSARRYLIFGLLVAFSVNFKIFEGIGDARVASSIYMFLFGSATYLFRHHVSVQFIHLPVLLAATLLTGGDLQKLCLYSFIYVLVLYLGCMRPTRLFVIRNDYSYGIYLYGFPVQQIFAFLWPTSGAYANFLVSLLAVLCLAIPSWHLVERPFIGFGHGIFKGRLPTAGTWARLAIPVIAFALVAAGAKFGSPTRQATFIAAQQAAK